MPRRFLISLLRAYKRFVSPLLGSRCRFFPTCSVYMQEALQRHGVLAGLLMGGARLCRCQPLCEGGHDPVRPRFDRDFFRRNLVPAELLDEAAAPPDESAGARGG